MKFKIGDKVRVVEWLDMPQDVMVCLGKNTYKIGQVGILVLIPERVMSLGFYDVLFKNEKSSIGFFEKELELLIKVGQQLEFNFMER